MTITVSNPGSPADSTAFSLSGSLTGYTAAPTLSYVDNPVVGTVSGLHSTSVAPNAIGLSWTAPAALAWQFLPAGSTVSKTGFTFTHPGVVAGNYVTDVSDGVTAGSVSYAVVGAPPVTHTSVIAKLNQLKSEIDGIIADVSKLSP